MKEIAISRSVDVEPLLAGRRPCWAEIDLDAIASNLRAIRARVGSSRRVLAVVKADAYGHGAVAVASRLEQEGADAFGTAMVEEGIELRRAGVRAPIVVLGPLAADQIPRFAEWRLTPTATSMAALASILEGVGAGLSIPFHLKIDTGMGRLGLTPDQIGAALDRIEGVPAAKIEGALTTLANGDRLHDPRTAEQIRVFGAVLDEIRRRGHRLEYTHLANSGGVLHEPAAWLDTVRPGIALYGVGPGDGPPPTDLRPALTLRSRVVLLKTVPAGTPIGYGGVFVAKRESRIATVAAGYDDGLRRLLHDGGQAIVRGRLAPYAGRISMDLSSLDVTGIDGVVEGDVVTLIGAEGRETVSAWDHARLAKTIPYEILCGIGLRVPRIYLGEGAPRPIHSCFDD